MTQEDLLERANELVAKTNATRADITARLDVLERRALRRQEVEEQLRHSHQLVERGSQFLSAISAGAVGVALAGIVVASDVLPVAPLAGFGVVFLFLASAFTARYERVLRRELSRATRPTKAPGRD